MMPHMNSPYAQPIATEIRIPKELLGYVPISYAIPPP